MGKSETVRAGSSGSKPRGVAAESMARSEMEDSMICHRNWLLQYELGIWWWWCWLRGLWDRWYCCLHIRNVGGRDRDRDHNLQVTNKQKHRDDGTEKDEQTSETETDRRKTENPVADLETQQWRELKHRDLMQKDRRTQTTIHRRHESIWGRSRRDRLAVGNLHHRQRGTEMAERDEKNNTVWSLSKSTLSILLGKTGIMLRKRKTAVSLWETGDGTRWSRETIKTLETRPSKHWKQQETVDHQCSTYDREIWKTEQMDDRRKAET